MAKSSSSSSSSTSRAAQPQPKSKPAAKRTWKARTPAQKLKKRERVAAARAWGELDRSLQAWREKLRKKKQKYHDKKPSARYNKETKCSKGERLDDYVQYKCALKDAGKKIRGLQRESDAKDQLFLDFKTFMRSGGSIFVKRVNQFLAQKALRLL